MSGGSNWFDYLAVATNTANTSWNFAQAGATGNNDIVASAVPSLVQQVATFQEHADNLAWDPRRTLFGIWIGINDVRLGSRVRTRRGPGTDFLCQIGFAYFSGIPFPSVMGKLLASYSNQIGVLYASGGGLSLVLRVVTAADMKRILQRDAFWS